MKVTTSLSIEKDIQKKVKETGMSYSFLIQQGLKYVGERKGLNKIQEEIKVSHDRMDRRINNMRSALSELTIEVREKKTTLEESPQYPE